MLLLNILFAFVVADLFAFVVAGLLRLLWLNQDLLAFIVAESGPFYVCFG